MCDCYSHKCLMCDEYLSMHLADFNTASSEIDVFCDQHIPEDTSDGVLWEWSDEWSEDGIEKEPTIYKRMFIRWLTDNAQRNAEGNHPNTYHTRVVEQKDWRIKDTFTIDEIRHYLSGKSWPDGSWVRTEIKEVDNG